MRQVALRIFAALCVGLSISLMLIEEDAHVKHKVAQYINAFMSTTYHCNFDARVKSINIFRGSLELEAVTVSSEKQDWSWCADTILVSLSLWRLIKDRVFALTYSLHAVRATSVITDSQVHLADHIKDLVVIPAQLPTQFVGLSITHGLFSANLGNSSVHVPFDIEFLQMQKKPSIKIHATVFDVALAAPGISVRAATAQCNAFLRTDTGKFEDVQIKGTTDISVFEKTIRCHLTSTLTPEGIVIQYHTDDDSITGNITYNTSIQAHTEVALKPAARLLGYDSTNIDGSAHATVCYSLEHGLLEGEYRVHIKKDDIEHTVTGELKTVDDFIITGSYADHSFKACVARTNMYLKNLEYQINDVPILSVTGTVDGVLSVATNIEAIAPIAPFPLQGTGAITCVIQHMPQGITLSAELRNAAMRIPATYNVIKSAHAQALIRMNEGCCDIDALEIEFYKGKISASKGRMYYSKGQINWAYLPVFFKHCFFSIQKDAFIQFSGSTILNYAHDSGCTAQSYVLLEHSYFRSNIMAPDAQKKLLSFGSSAGALPKVVLDARIETRDPVNIKTPFFDADAHIRLTIRGTLPHVDGSGEITLEHGVLKFPYKPLYVTHGKLYFLPGQMFDPQIELTAKNTIKKYAVNLSVRGTVKEPFLSFEASPTLEEPQIITLLLGGSEDGSLYFAMPDTITQAIKNMLFGPSDSASKISRYFKKLMRPLENIRLVPSFTDQSGRGGVRGSLAVEVNDRLRGFIEKNFNLTEDVKFGVEYDISDDTSVRGIRDERGDIGGEIEMRWKM